MKWALMYCVLSLGAAGQPVLEDPKILQTFVTRSACIEEHNIIMAHARKVSREVGRENSPDVYIICLPYTGPWKKEVKDG